MERLRAAERKGSEMRKGYCAVVESGSCSMDYQRWEEAANCGHAHRTYEAAEACRVKLQDWSKDRKECSAKWYNSRIHDMDGHRVDLNNRTASTPKMRSQSHTHTLYN